jgi:uncharacterized membrane protein YgcG
LSPVANSCHVPSLAQLAGFPQAIAAACPVLAAWCATRPKQLAQSQQPDQQQQPGSQHKQHQRERTGQRQQQGQQAISSAAALSSELLLVWNIIMAAGCEARALPWSSTVLPMAQLGMAVWSAAQASLQASAVIPSAATPGGSSSNVEPYRPGAAAFGGTLSSSNGSTGYRHSNSSANQGSQAAPQAAAAAASCHSGWTYAAADFQETVEHITTVLLGADGCSETAGSECDLLQAVQAASPDELRCMWQVLFVHLAWYIADDRLYWQQALSVDSSTAVAAAAWPVSSGGRAQQQELFSCIPCYHAQFLETMGALPPAPLNETDLVPFDALLKMRSLALHASWDEEQCSSSSSGSGSSGGGSSSSIDGGSTASARLLECGQTQPPSCGVEQWGWALPCPEAPLMLLELLLLELLGSRPAMATLYCPQYTDCMLEGLASTSPAAAATAAGVMLQGALTLLPEAVLQAAAAAGCPGLRL